MRRSADLPDDARGETGLTRLAPYHKFKSARSQARNRSRGIDTKWNMSWTKLAFALGRVSVDRVDRRMMWQRWLNR